MDIPFAAFGREAYNNAAPLEDEIECPRCGALHDVQYGDRINKDGTRSRSRALAFVRCDGKSYLVGILGKRIDGVKIN
jgi:hypothetical protein